MLCLTLITKQQVKCGVQQTLSQCELLLRPFVHCHLLSQAACISLLHQKPSMLSQDQRYSRYDLAIVTHHSEWAAIADFELLKPVQCFLYWCLCKHQFGKQVLHEVLHGASGPRQWVMLAVKVLEVHGWVHVVALTTSMACFLQARHRCSLH